MSASNWAVCPRCKKRAQAELVEIETELAEAYGKLPLNEFDDLRAEVNRRRDYVKTMTPATATSQQTTLREDYETWGAETGVVTYEYSASCDNCGLSLHFKIAKEFDV